MIYRNNSLSEISFPLGGIGTGCIGLCGNGMLKDWEIFNKPNKGSVNGYSHIAIKLKYKGKSYIKVLNGDVTTALSGVYKQKMFTGFGYGPDKETMCGFPHFRDCTFKGEFPFAEITFADDDFPVRVKLRAYNPFIPMDEDNSSIPCAIFDVDVLNTLDAPIDLRIAFSVMNPFEKGYNVKTENGLMLCSTDDKQSTSYGDLTVLTDCPDYCVQEYWHRTNWMLDNVTRFWEDLSRDEKPIERHYDEAGKEDHGTVFAHTVAKANEHGRVKLVLAWSIPNRANDWSKPEPSRAWKNYYATLFDNSNETAKYVLKNSDMLYKRSDAFRKLIQSTTADKAVIDAASSNLTALRAATIMRLEDGSFYGFEGAHEHAGSCEGTCQHVYNYAYALCFLFPRLEKSIRDLEFKYSTLPSGYMGFRLMLPVGSGAMIWHACVDGQMGAVIKCYREWKLSGDTEWLKANWDNIKLVLNFARSKENGDKWDLDGDGILEGRQHQTLDAELFGPSSWLEGMYVLALKCAIEMAEYLGDDLAKTEYLPLYENGRDFIKNKLFNGKYFIQQIDIQDKKYLEPYGEDAVKYYWDDECGEVKYQIGEGSSIDQLLARWHGNIIGVDGIFDDKQTHTALKNMYKNNFKQSLRSVANSWRIFALNDESGAIICDYPKGSKKPIFPICYTEECNTGFEYAFAGLLISEGLYDEGISIVKAIRNRYDGKKRNPYNEIECGSNYSRSMASFALLPILSGFTFDLPHNEIGFKPLKMQENYKTFFACGSCYGQLSVSKERVKISLTDGTVELSALSLPFIKNVDSVSVDGKDIPFRLNEGRLTFDKVTVTKNIIIK